MAVGDIIVINGKVLVSDSVSAGQWEVCIVGTTTTTTTTSTTTTATTSTTTTTTTLTTPTTTTGSTTVVAGGRDLFFDILADGEELNLTYEEFIDKKVNEFYESSPNIFNNKTDEEKEEIILNLVGEGELFVDVAIEIAKKEGIDIN